MSLGLSLAFATNPFQLLVSCPWVMGVPRGEERGLGCWGWSLVEGGDAVVKGQLLLLEPCPLGLWPHPTPNLQGEHLCEWLLFPVWVQPTATTPEVPKGPQR